MAYLELTGRSPEKCIVCFSAYNATVRTLDRPDRYSFTFFKQLEPIISHDIIFVGDESNSWYNKEISGLCSGGLENNLRALEDKISGYKDVKVVGSSMGGYASLFAYDLSNVRSVLSLQPQFFIKKEWPRSHSCNSSYIVNRLDGFKINSQKHLNIVLGSLSLFDIYQTWLAFGDHISEFCTIVPGAYHNVSFHWHERGVLDRAFSVFAEGRYFPGMSPYLKPYNYYDEDLIIAMPRIDEYYRLLYESPDHNSLVSAWSCLSRLPDSVLSLESIRIERGLLAARLSLFDESLAYLSNVSRLVEDKYGPLSLIYAIKSQYLEFENCIRMAVKINASGSLDSYMSKAIARRNLLTVDQLGSIEYVLNSDQHLLQAYRGIVKQIGNMRSTQCMTDLSGDSLSYYGSISVSEKEPLNKAIPAADQAVSLHEAQQARDEQTATLQSLQTELTARKAERDAATKDKAAAQQSATDLKQQLAAQAETLQQVQHARDEQAAKLQALQTELTALKDQQAAAKQGLQRVRQLLQGVSRSHG